MYTFYSQLGEDIYIFKNFINKKVEDGIFVELGAMDGIIYSNSKFFEDTLNFKGVLIEPTSLYNNLIINRPNCKNYNYAINYSIGNVEFIGDYAASGLTSTMSEVMKNKFHSNSAIYEVPCIPIKNLLNDSNLKYIDIFFIDVEGAEKIILETMDWNIEVYIIVIELHGIDIEKDNSCREILIKLGFEYHSTLCCNEVWINNNYSRKNILYDPALNEINKINNIFDIGYFPHVQNEFINEIIDTINSN